MTRTNAYSILCVFIRTFALWFLLRSLIGLPGVLEAAKRYDPGHPALILGIGVALPVALGVLIWLFADKLAKLALARPQQQVFESDIPVAEWQAVAFSVVGIWNVVAALVDLAHRIVQVMLAHSVTAEDGAVALWPEGMTSELVGLGMQLLLGLVLLFGARGLVGLIRKYRQVGYKAGEPSAPEHSKLADATDSAPPV